MLTGVRQINQKQFKTITKFAIRSGGNILVLGPSGGGKTIMTQEAAAEEKCKMIYINLAVLERTDFQGFPVISDDRSLVSYATPDFLPFADTSFRDETASLENFKKGLEDTEENKEVLKFVNNRLKELKDGESAKALVSAAPYLQKSKGKALDRIKELAKYAQGVLGKEESIVFLFDEVDKAATETTQTLLELLQFGSVNGRKLNIKANILTGNLPDEHAHSNQISHAISKRCKTYKLDLEFNMWREWAFKHGVHDHIVQFLSSKPEWLYKTAPDGDPTAYALPSPRTWTEAAKDLKLFDNDKELSQMSEEKSVDFKMDILAGNVGDLATVEFQNWYTYYRRFDPMVEALVETGKKPDISKLKAEELMILAISACSKVYAELRPKNQKRIESVTKNVYTWLDELNSDVQMGAIRLSFGGDWDNCHKYNLANIPIFVKVFKEIKQKMNDYDADLSASK